MKRSVKKQSNNDENGKGYGRSNEKRARLYPKGLTRLLRAVIREPLHTPFVSSIRMHM